MTDAQKTILVVDDEMEMLRILTDRFTLEGFTVLKARNGEEGLEAALDRHPDIIILDVLMPRMDGITMAKKLREDTWGKTVPIVMLTNLGSPPEGIETLQKEYQVDYIVKANTRLDEVVSHVRMKLLH